MPRPPANQPTDGELEILRVLWQRGATSLSELCKALREQRDVATTTVATVLRVMLEKGLVRREGQGRGATWAAKVTQEKAAKGMVKKLVEGVFDGSADRLATHLIEGGQLSAAQLKELRKLIDRQSRQ